MLQQDIDCVAILRFYSCHCLRSGPKNGQLVCAPESKLKNLSLLEGDILRPGTRGKIANRCSIVCLGES